MKTYWILGASTGIGKALAEELLAQGQQVVISARSQDKLAAMANGQERALAIALDLTDAQAVAAALAQIQTHFGGLDVVVANAGVCHYIDLPALPLQAFRDTFEVNFFAMVQLTELCLPALRQSHCGQLVYVSSSAAFLPLPRAQAYGASKAALSHFAEIMAAELKADGIAVTLVSPGFVDTPLTAKNDFNMPMRVSAQRAAQIMAKGIAKQQAHIAFPWFFTLLLRLAAALPTGLRRKLVAKSSRYQGTAKL